MILLHSKFSQVALERPLASRHRQLNYRIMIRPSEVLYTTDIQYLPTTYIRPSLSTKLKYQLENDFIGLILWAGAQGEHQWSDRCMWTATRTQSIRRYNTL